MRIGDRGQVYVDRYIGTGDRHGDMKRGRVYGDRGQTWGQGTDMGTGDQESGGGNRAEGTGIWR